LMHFAKHPFNHTPSKYLVFILQGGKSRIDACKPPIFTHQLGDILANIINATGFGRPDIRAGREKST
jgi:hypothetical protein